MQSKLLILRKNNRLSQKEVAHWLGISQKTYGLKERGDAAFDSDEMFTLSKKFNESIDNIFLPREHRNGNKIN